MGNFPLLLFIKAPISLKGSITRDIGLFDKEESPIKLAFIPSPET